jgi:hypothetical protein
LAGEYNLRPGPVARAWEYWSVRLDKAEGNWAAPKAKTAAPKQRPAKRMAKKSKTKAKQSRRGR